MNETTRAFSSTLDYEEMPYRDASYEIIGAPPGADEFLPMAVEIVPTGTRMHDPMFADFGGGSSAGQETKWHMPVGGATPDSTTPSREEEDAGLVKLREEELEAIRADAEANGRAQAQAEAQELIDANNRQINERVGQIVNDMVQQLREHVAAHEKTALELALQISRKLLHDAVEINPEYITPIITAALGQTGGAQIRRVRVSPQDLEFITVVGLHETLKEYDGTWNFESDDTVQAGCIVETSAGEVDFDLQRAWDRIRDNVVKVVK